MRRKVAILLVLVPLSACGRPQQRPVAWYEQAAGPPANLLLGPNAADMWVALDQPARDEWPSIATGYRLDELTYYDVSIYDEQSHFDRYGSLYQTNVSTRSGIFLPR